MSAIGEGRTAVTLRPLVARVGGSILLSAALITVPPFAALYFLTASSGGWPFLLALQVAVSSVAVVGSASTQRAVIRIGDDGFTETGYFGGRTKTSVADIGSILVIPVAAGQALATNDNVFVLDHAGRTRLRVRGQYWGTAVVRAITTAFDVPVLRIENAMTPAEMRHAHRSKLYFHERHPMIVTSALAIAIVGITLPIMITINNLL